MYKHAMNSLHWFKDPCLHAIVYVYTWMHGDSVTNQQQCDHSQCPEANVGQQCGYKNQITLYANDVDSTDHNQPRQKPAVGFQPGKGEDGPG